MQGEIEQRNIDVAPAAARARAGDARQQRKCRRESGHQIDCRQAVARRWAIRLAGQRHVTRFGLHQVIVTGPGRA